MVDFDYVIVGAGAAGCVLASRLSEDPGNQVLLLEYGGRDANPLLYPPERFYSTVRGNRYAYHYPTRPIGPGGQVEAWMRGKVLGGSTAVNGMMRTRGAAADWDRLAARGIGRPDVLRRAGADLRVDSPNVGERIIEQRGVSIQVRVKGNLGPTQDFNSLPKQGWQGVTYLVTRGGPIATGGHDLVSQFKSSCDPDRPDIQGVFAPIALDPSGTTSLKLAEHSGVNFLGYQIRPTTTSAATPGCASLTPPSCSSRSPETPRPLRWRSPGSPPTSSAKSHK